MDLLKNLIPKKDFKLLSTLDEKGNDKWKKTECAKVRCVGVHPCPDCGVNIQFYLNKGVNCDCGAVVTYEKHHQLVMWVTNAGEMKIEKYLIPNLPVCCQKKL